MALEISDVLIQQRSKKVQVFEHKGRDILDDTMKTARDLGDVRLDHSRLNLFSALSKGDKEDNFKFKAITPGPLRFGVWGEGLRIELMDSRGKLIADSEGTDKYLEKYRDIIKSKERIEAGEYYVRVSRSDSRDTTTEIPYSLQVQMGSYVVKDFDSIEYEADPRKKAVEIPDLTAGATPTGANRQMEMVATMLGNGLNNFNDVINRTRGIFSTIMGRMFGS